MERVTIFWLYGESLNSLTLWGESLFSDSMGIVSILWLYGGSLYTLTLWGESLFSESMGRVSIFWLYGESVYSLTLWGECLFSDSIGRVSIFWLYGESLYSETPWVRVYLELTWVVNWLSTMNVATFILKSHHSFGRQAMKIIWSIELFDQSGVETVFCRSVTFDHCLYQ